MRRALRRASLAAALAVTAALAIAAAAAPAPRAGAPARPDDTDARATGRAASAPDTLSARIPPAPGAPHFAWLDAFEGLPADSIGRAAVLAGFRGAFAAPVLATARLDDDHAHPHPSVPLSNRFRLIEGTSGLGAWRLQIAIRHEGRFSGPPVAPGADDADALEVAVFQVLVAALPPDADPRTSRPLPARTRVAFEPPADAEASLALHERIGRTLGRLALEHLHRGAGELDDDTELALGDDVRRGTFE